MKTIDRRGYVWKKGKSLVPAFRAFAVVNLSADLYFADLVDYQFTAAMKTRPRRHSAEGRQDLEPWLRRFYYGDPEVVSQAHTPYRTVQQ